MKNKKADFPSLFLIVLFLLGIAVVILFILNHYEIITINTAFDKCEKNCENMDMEFMSYNTALFSHNECWCKKGNETRRIY